MVSETQFFEQQSFHLAGGTLPVAITAYRTHGDPANPCIVFPTCYGARLEDQYYLVGEGKALDTSKYFVVTFALFSNGESSSPSNTPAPHNGPYFPKVSYADNIRAQHAVLQILGVKKIHCVVGFSMGGQQTYFWACMYPDMVERPSSDSSASVVRREPAPTTNGQRQNYATVESSPLKVLLPNSFIEGPKAALLASRDYEYGHYTTNPQQGIRAFGRVYSAWAYGQTWFREHGYLYNGKYADLESWMKADWENGFSDWDANDLITLINTWSDGDISTINHHKGDYVAALKSIKAKGLIMPAKTDLYFPPEDSQIEVSHLPNAKLAVIDTVWGHMAGGGSNDKDMHFMTEQISRFLIDQ